MYSFLCVEICIFNFEIIDCVDCLCYILLLKCFEMFFIVFCVGELWSGGVLF